MARHYLYAYRIKVKKHSDGTTWRRLGGLDGLRVGGLFEAFLLENREWNDQQPGQGSSKIVLIGDPIEGVPDGVHGVPIRVGSTGNEGEIFETDGDGSLGDKKTDLADTDAHLADGHIFGFLPDDQQAGHIILHTRSTHRVKTVFWAHFDRYLKAHVPDIVVEFEHCAPAETLDTLLDNSDLKRVRLTKTLMPGSDAEARHGLFGDKDLGKIQVEFIPTRNRILDNRPVRRITKAMAAEESVEKAVEEADLLTFGGIAWDSLEAVGKDKDSGQTKKFSVTNFGDRVPRIGLDITDDLPGSSTSTAVLETEEAVTPSDDHEIEDPVAAVVYMKAKGYVADLSGSAS